MIVYNKLVRDKIPEIIRRDKKHPVIEILDDNAYELELKKKLMEEINEYNDAKTKEEAVEELADVMEVIHALSKVHGKSIDEIDLVRKEKFKKRGGFTDKVFLLGVKE